MTDAEMIDAFVNAFAQSDDLVLFRQFSLPRGVTVADVAPLLTEDWQADDEVDGWAKWRPIRVDIPPEELKILYRAVRGPLPPLYERLVLSYQWAEVTRGDYRLLASFPPTPLGLVRALTVDRAIFTPLAEGNFVQFGRGADADYDPVCFDLNSRLPNGDCPIVKVNHEELLGRGRVHIVKNLAGSFRELIEGTIRVAD